MATFYGKASEIENNSNKIDVIKHSDTDKSIKYPSEQAIIDFLGGAEYQNGYVVVGDGSTGGIKSSGIKADYLNTAYTSSLMLEDAAGKIRDGNIVVGSPGTLPYPHYVKDSGVTLADLQSAIDKKATISNALQPYEIPMGSPTGDGTLWGGTGVKIQHIRQQPELITTATTTEYVGGIVIDTNTEKGKSLQLRDWITILLDIPAYESASNIAILLNSKNAGLLLNGTNTSARYNRCTLRWNGAMWESYTIVAASASTHGTVNTISRYFASDAIVTSITLTGNFPAGTKYSVYGITA